MIFRRKFGGYTFEFYPSQNDIKVTNIRNYCRNSCVFPFLNQGVTMKKEYFFLLSALLAAGCASDVDSSSEFECRDTPNGTVYFCPVDKMCGEGRCVAVDDTNCESYGKGCSAGNTCDTQARKCVCKSNDDTYCSLLCTADGCVDPNTNPDHCGGEGNKCDASKAEMCVNGTCMDKCPADYEECIDAATNAKVCADTANDPNHCGACGNKCPESGQNHVSRSYCRQDECQIVCMPSYFDADGDISNGCEKQITNVCGNGIVEEGEVCDGLKLNDQSCATLVGEGSTGTIYCNSDCSGFNTDECTPATTCGNGKIDAGEVCDGAAIGGATCAQIRGEGSTGHLGCQSNCADYDKSGCSAPTTCGNGKLDVGEECDGDLMNHATCESVRGVGSTGTLKCKSTCEFDISDCGAPSVCGNGRLEEGEVCDGTNFNGATCESLVGLGSTGTLLCDNCGKISTDNCSAPSTCGNDKVDNTLEKCDGQDLNGQTCASVVGLGSTGTLKCASNCGSFDISECTAAATCGDGIVQPNEVCDGLKLNDRTCATEVGAGSTGILRCNSTCSGFDKSSCTASTTCNNGVLEKGEVCDLANVGSATCESEVGAGSKGVLLCGHDCTYLNRSGCSAATLCNNGKIDDGEKCDGKNLNGETCATVLGEGATGTLKCGDGCKHFDTSSCTPPTTCGNGKIDGYEVCDSSELNGKTCADIVGFGSKGVLTCNATCSGYDTSRCTPEVTCGNGKLDAGEVCDGSMLNGATCSSLVGYGSTGTPVCNSTCSGFVTHSTGVEGCSEAKTCGNGILDPGEVCDGYNLNENTCATVIGYGSTGTPKCNSTCSGFLRGTCTNAKTCGNGKIDDDEDCDGALLNGATCETVLGQGATGTLRCGSTCKFDTTLCVAGSSCGNGKLDDGETCDGKLFKNNSSSCNKYAPSIYASGSLSCNNCQVDTSACVPFCGNGVVNTTVGGVSIDEKCDGTNFPRGQDTCEKVVGPGSTGTLSCSDDCKQIIKSQCTAPAICGDGVLNQASEQCDGNAIAGGSADCSAFSTEYEAGTNVKCLSNCTVDTSVCKKKETARCGDGIVNGDEDCDKDAFYADVTTCADYAPKSYSGGNLKCTNSCKYDFSDCQKIASTSCGNGKLDDDELCDGGLFYQNIKDCAVYSASEYSGGTLKCTDTCEIDESACIAKEAPRCGNGKIDPGEVCDGSKLSLASASCKKYAPSKYEKGSIKCSDDCKSYDFSDCTEYCGNGSLNSYVTVDNVKYEIGEQCDNDKFATAYKTCEKAVGKGSTGTLSCNDDCTVNTTQCTQSEYCGDGIVNGDESCDGEAFLLDETTCKGWSPLYESGTVSCNKDCTVDFSACKAAQTDIPDVCGDGIVGKTEECDGSLLGSGYTTWDCSAFGDEYVGTMTCGKDCKLDVSSCVIRTTPKTCGNGKIDADELCDGSLFWDNADDCAEFGNLTGKTTCTNDCQISTASCKPNVCGDGILGDDEWCDRDIFAEGYTSCADVGNYSGGSLKCTDKCEIDESGCIARCGNGILDKDEFCDPKGPIFDKDADTCNDWIPGTVGTLSCTKTCTVDYSQCQAKPTAYCGDGIVNTANEECDDTAFVANVTTCAGYSNQFVSGNLKCTKDCKYDFSDCHAPSCGDKILDANEECDGSNFMYGIKTCVDYSSTAYKGGLLKCTDKCTIDTSECISTAAVCNNGILEEGEYCDTNKFIDNEDDCTYWGDFESGKVTCSATCEIVTTSCVKKPDARCGDNKVNTDDEDCDNNAFLADVTACAEYDPKVYSGGNLKCTSACKYDFSECQKIQSSVCGDGILNEGEQCDTDKFILDIVTCQDYSSAYNNGNLKCTKDCRLDLSDCEAKDACKEDDIRCYNNILQMCGKSGNKPANWEELQPCKDNQICDSVEIKCLDKPADQVDLQWCTFHWLDTTNRIGYGRILHPTGITADDYLAYVACTNDIQKPVSQWDPTEATLNNACADCGNNKEYMTTPIKGSNGVNYCTFIFDFVDRGMFACLPRQTGESVPIRIVKDATKLDESLTRTFTQSAPTTDCKENNFKCESNVLSMCMDGKWTIVYNCSGDKPVCDANVGDCVAATTTVSENKVNFNDLDKHITAYNNAKSYSFADGSTLSFSNVAIYTKDHIIEGTSLIARGDRNSAIKIANLPNGIAKLSFDYTTWNTSETTVNVTVKAGAATQTLNITKSDTTTKTASFTFNDKTAKEVTINFGQTAGRAVIDNISFIGVK